MSNLNQRAPILAPGSNLKGQAAGAAWTYLLPSLELQTAICIGEPSRAAMATLQRLAARVVVVNGRDAEVPEGVVIVRSTRELAEGTADLVYLATGEGGDDDVGRLVSADGALYLESPSGRRQHAMTRWLQEQGLGTQQLFWLSPRRGEARSAVPVHEPPIRRFFDKHRITVSSAPPWLEPLRSGRLAVFARERMGIIASRPRPVDAPLNGVPRYLGRVASSGGIDLGGFRFGLSARGRYNSRKVIFYLFGPGSDQPDLIAKTTREPNLNDRLLAEEVALKHIAAARLVPEGTAPKVAFSGEHGGLRIVGETVVTGSSLDSGTGPQQAERALEWLTGLALASAHRSPSTASAIRRRLDDLVDSVERMYEPDPAVAARIEGFADDIRARADQLPLVFSHGDAATWNAVLLEDGRVAFLDWEAAHDDGMPLWDMFYFARSRFLARSRLRRRLRPKGAGMIGALRADRGLWRAVEAYREELEVPGQLIEPLFALCWADRALREVTRLPHGDMASGHYIGLVQEIVGSRSPTGSSSGRA